MDATGAPVTGLSINWVTNVMQYGTWMTGTTPDRFLFTNALYGVYADSGHITLTGVPYPSYAVIIYNMNGNGTATQYWDKDGDAATRVYGLPQLASEYTDTFLRAEGTDPATANIANYTVFAGLTSPNVTFNWQCGAQTSMACGIQIIPTPLVPVDPLTDDLPLISPAAGQTGVIPRAALLVWDYREVLYLGGQFKVYLKQGSAPGSGDVIATLPELAKTLRLGALLPSTTYYWKVEVFQGASSKMSEVRSFVTGADRPNSAYPGTAGRILHLDASAGVQNASAAPAANGEKVATWADQSGAGNNVANATDAARPVFKSLSGTGLPSVFFTRNTTRLFTANTTAFGTGIGTGDFDVFVLSYTPTMEGNTYVIGNRSTTGATSFWFGWSGTGVYSRIAPDVALAPATGPPMGGRWLNYNFGRQGAFSNYYIEGVNVGSMASTPANLDSDQPLTIGNANLAGGWGLNGEISEVLFFNRGLTDPEKLAINQYLVAKYCLDKPVATSMVTPAANANVSKDEDVVLKARVFPFTGSTVSNVEFFANGVSVGSTTVKVGREEYSIMWAPPAVGAYNIVALATASNGLQSAASVTVNSLELAPSIAFSTPSPEVSPGPTVDFPTSFTAVGTTFALTADEVTLAASDGTVTGEIEIVPGLLPRTPIIRVKNITGYGSLRVCILAGAGTSPYGLGSTPTAISPVAKVAVVSVPGAPTTPAGTSALWWDAQDIDGSGNSTLANGAYVTTWKDKSGNANDGLKQATGTGPVFNQTLPALNNKSSVRFTGVKAQQAMKFTTALTTVRSVFWVTWTDPTNIDECDILLGTWEPDGYTGWNWYGDPNRVTSYWWGHPFLITHGDTPATWRLLGNVFDAEAVDVGPYKHTIISVDTGGDMIANYFAGDSRASYTTTRQAHGYLTEMIIYTRLLTEAERNQTGAYLANKYMMDWPGLRPYPPTVELVYPTVGAIALPSDNVSLKATATGGSGASIASVEFYADGVLVGTATTRNALGQYVVSWTTPATEGRVLIFARALDNLTPTAAAGVSAQVYLSVVNPMFATVTGAGTHGGASWATAMTLDEAMTAAGEVLVTPPIYVKTGTYPRAASYTFTSGLALFGGFAGTETKASQRTGTPGVDNVTTLDAGGAVEGIFHNGGQSITLDRLTFTRSADSAVTLANGTNTVNNCSFTNNVATGPGGGIHVEQGTTHVTHSVFKDNTAGYWGGGGIGHYGANIIVDSCWFENNQALGANGGAIDNWWGDVCLVTNSVFVNNTSELGGGAIETDGAPAWIFNNTFVGNQSTGSVLTRCR
jgi:hypothetical protein